MNQKKISAFTAKYIADRALIEADRKAAKLHRAAHRADQQCEKAIVNLQRATAREWNTKPTPRKL